MSDKELEIFELCERLAELLGDKEAIADLKKLYANHPEMFRDMQDIKEIINKVVSEPEIIINNPKARVAKDLIVAKRLDERKMGDVGIRNDEGTNVIYHTNKKNIRGFYKLQSLVETPSAKAAPTWSDHCADKSKDLPKCIKAPSTTANDIIPQNKDENQAKQEQIKALKEKVKESSKNLKGTPKDKDIEL